MKNHFHFSSSENSESLGITALAELENGLDDNLRLFRTVKRHLVSVEDYETPSKYDYRTNNKNQSTNMTRVTGGTC